MCSAVQISDEQNVTLVSYYYVVDLTYIAIILCVTYVTMARNSADDCETTTTTTNGTHRTGAGGVMPSENANGVYTRTSDGDGEFNTSGSRGIRYHIPIRQRRRRGGTRTFCNV